MLDVVQKGVYDRCYCRLLQLVFIAYNEEDTTIRTNRNENRKREDKNDKGPDP